jgi:hypothetical protein
MEHCETLSSADGILNEIMPAISPLSREEKLTKRFLLTTVGFLKRRMALTSVSLLSPVIEILVEIGGEYTIRCSSIIANTCSLVLSREVYTRHIPMIRRAFQTTMAKHFSFRSKRFFELFISLSKFSATKIGMRKYLQDEVLPLIMNQITVAEDKQGSGTNYSMR